MRAKLWPTGLVGRVSVVLFAAIVLELVASTIIFEQAEIISNDDSRAHRLAEEVGSAVRVLSNTDTAQRSAVARTLSDRSMIIDWRTSDDDERQGALSDQLTEPFVAKILQHEPALRNLDLQLHAKNTTLDGPLQGTLRLPDRSVLRFEVAAANPLVPTLIAQLWSIALLSGCVLLAALLIVRTLASPLRMLVKATDAIGHGPSIHIDESGPGEIRRVAQAFNAMQDRIAKLINDRTEALAAVSHDLRTPLGRLRLRAGFLSDPADQAAFETDLSDMEAMLNDLLAYLGGETDPEKPKPTDIAATLITLVDAAVDAGRTASFEGPEHLGLPVRSLAVKRAFSNVINNALAYGDTVKVTLADSDYAATATFDDTGPGIPEAELAAVFEPFYRVDTARGAGKGGMGLGLAITRQAIWREGGTIELENRPEGGLRVTITLPRPRKAAPDQNGSSDTSPLPQKT